MGGDLGLDQGLADRGVDFDYAYFLTTFVAVDNACDVVLTFHAEDSVEVGLTRGGFVDVPDGATTTKLPSSPVDFGGTPWAPRAMAPDAGAHTEQVLAELGRDAEAIEALRDKGIVV